MALYRPPVFHDLSEYEITEFIDSGGFGSVYKAKKTEIFMLLRFSEKIMC